jgi:hypothetical protein
MPIQSPADSAVYAWLLLAVSLATTRAQATLIDVIGAADAVNHAVPTPDELHVGLTALTSLGLIAAESPGIYMTPKGTAFVEEAMPQPRPSWQSQLKALHVNIEKLRTPAVQHASQPFPTLQQARDATQAYVAHAHERLGTSPEALHAMQLSLLSSRRPQSVVARAAGWAACLFHRR